MSDLIKREAVLATIGVMYERCGGDITDYRDLMLEAVKVLSSIDIVRCRECKHWQPRAYVDIDGGVYVDMCNREYAFGWDMNADDFCSYGERSE